MEEINLNTTDITSNSDSCSTSKRSLSRWTTVDFGMIPTLLKLVLVNISDQVCGIISIITTTLISIGDTISDFVVAFTLLFSGHYKWALAVIVVDYIPSWNILAHNITSSKWRGFQNTKEKVISILFLFLSPFSMALFHFRWLLKFESADQDTFDFLHHNARLSHLLSGSFESPIQIILLFILYGKEKLDSPFTDSSNCIEDSIGRQICLGILPGILSMLNSSSSVLKASIEISEGKSIEDKIFTMMYAFTNFTFRLPSIALLILFFDEWSIIVLIITVALNFIVIIRCDKHKRKEFSVFSSAVIATVSPFISSEQTNLYKRSDLQRQISNNVKSETNRKKLSAKVAMVTSPLLLISDITLLLLLNSESNFKYSEEIKMEKDFAVQLLMKFLVPMGLLTMVVNYLYGKHFSKDKDAMKYIFRFSVLIFLFIGALTTSGFAIYHFYGKNPMVPGNSKVKLVR